MTSRAECRGLKMARVNLEDRFFAGKGLKYLMGYSGLSKAECIGYLALLWHTSQRERIYKCPREELLFLMELDQSFFEEEKCTKFIQALIKSGFVSQDGHIYTICGNKDQIEGLDKFVEKQRGNAQKRWNNPQGQSDVKEEVIHVEENASGMPVASQDYPKKCPTFNIQYSNSNSQDSISNVQGSSSNVQGSSSKVQLTVQSTEILRKLLNGEG